MELTTQMVSLFLTAFIAYSGFLVGIIRWFQSKNETALNSRLEALEKSMNEVKADLKAISSNMPKEYVMKNDCLRSQEMLLSKLVIIDGKLDELAKKVYRHAEN